MVGASSDSKRSTTIQFPPFPGVADFGSQFESGVDYSEGIFMQSIYPRFGVGEEFNALAHFDRGTKRSNGLGKYGLAGDDAVHLTETSHSALIKDENQLSVLNSWGYYWGEKSIRSGNSSVDVEFPTRVLLEKSPPNMHMSRFLQALLNRGLFERSGSAPDVGFQAATRTAVKFVFISRHPIANSLAHKALKECAAIPVIELVEHWLFCTNTSPRIFRFSWMRGALR